LKISASVQKATKRKIPEQKETARPKNRDGAIDRVVAAGKILGGCGDFEGGHVTLQEFNSI